jgi:hypothetical protein
MPAAHYDEWRHEHSLIRPTRTQLDEELSALCDRFAAATEAERARMRRSISMDGFYTLMTFSRRAAVFALRERRVQHVQDSLRALALIESERVDQRDIAWAMGIAYYAATRTALDAATLVRAAAALAEPDVATFMNDYPERHRDSKDLLQQWGYREVRTSDGPGLVAASFDSYDPTFPMLDLALEIAAVFEGDVYGASDVEVASTLPSVWLRPAAAEEVKAVLTRARAGAKVRGQMRPSGDPSHESQMLLVFIEEMRDELSAGSLLEMSRRSRWQGESVLGVSAGRLFCLVVGRSTVVGVPSYESAQRLERFMALLSAVVARYAGRSVS